MSDLIQRLRESYSRDCFLMEVADELERLQELTKNDAKEIGSYRDGTGLRGETRAQDKRIEHLEAALRLISLPGDVTDAEELGYIAREALEANNE